MLAQYRKQRRQPSLLIPQSDLARHRELHVPGRGGVGAVMGSKGVKVILLDGTGTKMREPKDKDAFNDANKRFNQGLKEHAVTGQGLPAYGTNVLTNVLSEAGGYPTYNFKQGSYPDADKISGETQAALEVERGGVATHGCHRGCYRQVRLYHADSRDAFN